MLEHIAEQIRSQCLSRLTWVSRPAGLAEVFEVRNGDALSKFPAAKPHYGMPCEPGDYLNMSPDGKEICLAFVDSAGEITVDEHTSMYDRVSLYCRVVVWYNDDRIRFDGAGDKSWQMVQEITNLVRAADMNIAGRFAGVRTRHTWVTTDPDKIWGAYGFKPDDALFLLPYRTFAVTFRTRAFLLSGCEGLKIGVNAVC